MPTTPLGTADLINIGSGEEGFELYLSTDTGTYVVNIHALAETMLDEAKSEIGPWIAEREDARATRHVTDDADAYPADDPKHPDWHSVHASHYDEREGK